jgi:hypothetical protein
VTWPTLAAATLQEECCEVLQGTVLSLGLRSSGRQAVPCHAMLPRYQLGLWHLAMLPRHAACEQQGGLSPGRTAMTPKHTAAWGGSLLAGGLIIDAYSVVLLHAGALIFPERCRRMRRRDAIWDSMEDEQRSALKAILSNAHGIQS